MDIPTPSMAFRAPALSVDGDAWRALAWAAIAAQGAAVLLAWGDGLWPGGCSMAATFACFLVFRLLPHQLPSLLEALATVAAGLSVAGWTWGWYESFPPFDEILHAANPLVIMAPCMWWLRIAGIAPTRPGGWTFVLQATLIGLVLGLAWEVIETTFLVLAWGDTLSDIALDVAGSAAGGALGGWVIRRQEARG